MAELENRNNVFDNGTVTLNQKVFESFECCCLQLMKVLYDSFIEG